MCFTLRLCILLLLIGPGYVKSLAQQLVPSTAKSKKLFDRAQQSLNKSEFGDAAQTLEELLLSDSLFVFARQQLATIYLREKQYQQAAKHYQIVARLAPDFNAGTWYGLGESWLNTGEYASAKAAFNTYLAKAKLTDIKRKTADKYLKDCDFSIAAIKSAKSFSIINMGEKINSIADEYFPMLTADLTSIIFTRQLRGGLEYIYSSQNKDDSWLTAQPIPGNVNTDQYSEGAHCISPDGKYLFFTGCNRPEGKGSCDIYVSYKEGDRWGEPHNLGSPINTGAWEAQPAISPDGNTLYFVSNRKGGLGGSDIWYSQLSANGNWSVPKNMGAVVNTPYDESTPFIHADNETLYFASNGWPGFGNKDLYISSVNNNGKRLPPINLGSPINDHLEQRALSVSMDGETAYFAAERSGGFGGLDIYTCVLDTTIRPKPVGFVRGNVYDKATGKPVRAQITLTKLSNNHVMYKMEADYIDGSFLIPLPVDNQYALHVQHPSYLFYSEHFTLENAQSYQDIYPIAVGLNVIDTGNTVTLNNIFFPVNGFELLSSSEADLLELLQFMQRNKHVSIEISGHTDNSGQEQNNQKLSEKRAFAVYQYLLDKGIAKQRMEYKGYGQKMPVADNETAAGKRKNRRTEFKIIATNYAK